MMNKIIILFVIVCAFSTFDSDAQKTAVQVMELETCSDEMQKQLSKMTPKEKSKELQKLQGKNTSALLMSNFMSEYVNWDQFLYDLPLMVTELGKLMLFSNKRDFTLFREGVQYEYIKSPDSFRATLVQLGHSEWTALYAAHKNMDTIRLNTLSVPGIFRLIFKILRQEKSAKNQNLLRAQLDRIKHFAEENRKVCEDSIDKINATINLINEIQIATLSAQSDQKDRLNLLLKQKAEYEAKRNNTEGMLGVINKDLQNQLANVKKLERDYEEAKRKSEVDFGEVFGSAVVDILKFAPTLISTVMAPMGMPPPPQPEQPRVQKKPKQAEENEEILEVNEAEKITEDLQEMLEEGKPTGQSTDKINNLIAKVGTFRDSKLANKLMPMLKKAKASFAAFTGMTNSSKAALKQQLFELGGMMKSKLAILLTKFAADGNSVMLNERLDSLGDASKGTYGQIMSARLAKLKSSTDLLVSANKQYEGLFTKKLVMMERNTEYISKLKSIDFTKVDFESILNIMKEGIILLGKHIEHWKRFLSFFQIIESLTKVASERTKLFINGTLMGIADGALMTGLHNDDIYMDMLYEHSYITIDIAKALNEMTSTYLRVSNKHVFPHLNGITKLLALEDPKEINEAFKKLAENAKYSTEELTASLREDYEQQRKRVKDRVRQITCYVDTIKEDPDVKQALEENNVDIDIPDF